MRRPTYFDHPRRPQAVDLPSKGVAAPSASSRQPVPWRTICATIVSVGGAYLAYQAFLSIGHFVTYMVFALFFPIVLTPPVDFVQHNLHLTRGLSTLIVLLIALRLLCAVD